MYIKTYIEWKDAYGINSGWDDIESAKGKELLVKTLGFIVLDSDEYLGVSSTIDEENKTMHNCIIIPKQMITKQLFVADSFKG